MIGPISSYDHSCFQSAPKPFIEHLISFFSGQHSLQTICKECLGEEKVSREIKDILLIRAQDFLSEDLLLKGHQSSRNDSQEFGDKLLLEAEVLRQGGDPEKAKQFETLAVRWSLAPHLLKGWSSTYQEITQKCISILKEIEQKKTDLKENYLAVETLIQSVVPKRTSTERIQQYVKKIFLSIQGVLQKNHSSNELDFHLPIEGALDRGYSKVYRKSRIWTHKTLNGVHFIYIPDPVYRRPREDFLDETMATGVYVPKVTSATEHFFTAQRARTFLYAEGNENTLNLERFTHELILSLPSAKKFFAPLPLTYKTYVVKTPGYESFQEDLRFTHSLPTEKLLDVYEGVLGGLKLLESYNYVSGDIKNENIVFKREADAVCGLIDLCMKVCFADTYISPFKTKRLNALAQNGYVSFEIHRYGLVIAIAEAFFLDLEDGLPLDQLGCERHALKRLKQIIYERHYSKVMELKKLHKSFGRGFSQGLLDYVTKIAKEGEEGLQRTLLEQFAFKMAIFPEISFLFLKTMKADASHRDLLNLGVFCSAVIGAEPRIPSLEEIGEVLLAGKEKLQNLHVVKERSSITEISLDQTCEIVRTLLNEDISERDLRIEVLARIINDVLKESPYIGSEVRIHKYKPWKDTSLRAPFSLWICVRVDSLRLEFFDPSHPDVLAAGGNKNVKAGLQVDISEDGTTQYTPIVISRMKRGALDWQHRLAKGNKMQEKILKIPGADKYFLGLSRQHSPHHVDYKRKLETISLRFADTLNGALEENVLQMKEGPLYLSKLDYIGFLQNIGEGIQLLRDQGISHGDMKVGNIGIVSTQEGLRALIFDYDFSQKVNQFFETSEYPFWNALRQSWGFVSAETDLYGYVLITAEVLLEDFKAHDSSEEKEDRILRFQRIAKEPAGEKSWMQERIENEILEMCPSLSEEMKSFFSKPLDQRGVNDIPKAFFDSIRNWDSEDFEVSDLEDSIIELLILDPVFDLLVKTFGADQRSKDLVKNPYETHSLLKALAESGFPTPEEIKDVLAKCEGIAKEVAARI